MLKWVGKKKDIFDKWLESDVAEPPSEPRTHNGMTDRELSAAICRVAIKEGIDPVKEGVVPSAAVMGEEDSEELAYKNQLKANLALSLARRFGVSKSAAQAALVTRGTIPMGPDDDPVDQAVMDLMLDSEDVQDLVFDGLPVEESVDLATLNDDSEDDLVVFAAFIRKAKEYDLWLRPFAVFIGSLMFAVATGLSAGSTVFLMIMAYGFLCGGFKPKKKALKEADPKKEIEEKPELPPCPMCRRPRSKWMGSANDGYHFCFKCRQTLDIKQRARRQHERACTDPNCHEC